ncbi:MAG: hypothetical protein AB7T16_03165 [Dehalococcoidia bacterium]
MQHLHRVLAARPLRGSPFRPVNLLPLFPDLVDAGVDPEAPATSRSMSRTRRHC